MKVRGRVRGRVRERGRGKGTGLLLRHLLGLLGVKSLFDGDALLGEFGLDGVRGQAAALQPLEQLVDVAERPWKFRRRSTVSIFFETWGMGSQ